MPMQDARDLHADITKLLVQLQELREQAEQKQEAIQVELTGGSF